MVERVSWFSPIDYEILSFFQTHDILVSPKVLSENIEYDRQYTSKRCRELEKANILCKKNSGLYRLSDTGKRFLSGDLSAENFERA